MTTPAPDTKRRYAMSFDTTSMPGSVKVTYVEFTNEIIPVDKFYNREFRIIDPRVPEFKSLKTLLKDSPDDKSTALVTRPNDRNDPAKK